ncbi:MAG: PSD1 and planctomycete cytochrome C domain-containing protein [Fuerstiella sp.]|nr:PSD1 and planctomycete cytochrome C domain-containing protein [Fuerstiella sp.]
MRYMTQSVLTAWAVSAMMPIAVLADRVDYERDVKPILKTHCYSCHGGLKQESGLRLDTGILIRAGGDGGPAVLGGTAERSLLVKRITESDESLRMPLESNSLAPEQIQLIRDWINHGALSPKDEQPEDDPRAHWAFKKPIRPVVPIVKNTAWLGNSVDAFLAAQHEQRGLVPLPAAQKHVLLRRVYFDLIGLPPNLNELRAFLTDESPNAFESVVDGLLERPEYGERWGRHWMDVWRYSDWYGRRKVPDCLNSYGQIWRWRDWIVRSVNEDKGYDRMIMEMLAADEIAPDDHNNIVATGFVVRSFYRWNYNTWMKDAVEHTGKAFLGLTLNCCHCHDHKYDPIANEEYFRFRAFFEPIDIRHDRVPGEPDPGAYPKYSYGKSYKPITSGLVRIMDKELDAKTFMYTGGEARNVIPNQPPVTPAAPEMIEGDSITIKPIDVPLTTWYPGLKPFVRREEISKAEADLATAKRIMTDSMASVATAKNDTQKVVADLTLRVDHMNVVRAEAALKSVLARIHADKIRYQNEPGDADDAARLASRIERMSILETARFELAQARRTLTLKKTGDKQPDDDKGRAEIKEAETKVREAAEAVTKAEENLATESVDYTAFSPKYPQRSTGRRSALAYWIASEDNPLTARVAVNHIWLRHFGRALVETTENLGRGGAKPTHPDLMDWLAVELMENSWKMKHIHRLIVTSNAYRTSSGGQQTSVPSEAVDPDNIYLWRFSSRRMDAEVLRDSILYLSGSLDSTMGGKEIDQSLGLTTPRRSLYFEHHGEGLMPFLDLFDAADPCDAYQRKTSIRPQQALAMANSDLCIREGRLLARRLTKQFNDQFAVTEDGTTFINLAWEQVLNRLPKPEEVEACVAFLSGQTQLYSTADADELQAAPEDEAVPASVDPMLRARESFLQALFNHHDFVTIR